MPTISSFEDVDIPDVDLWGLMFDRKSKDFPDSQGLYQVEVQSMPSIDQYSHISSCQL